MPICAILSLTTLASHGQGARIDTVPLHLTAKERSTLAMILALLVLGLIGMAIVRERAAPPTTASSPPPPAARP